MSDASTRRAAASSEALASMKRPESAAFAARDSESTTSNLHDQTIRFINYNLERKVPAAFYVGSIWQYPPKSALLVSNLAVRESSEW